MLDQQEHRTLGKDNDGQIAEKKPKPLKKLKTLDLGQSTDFMCDIDTGICGPITKKEEG